MFSVNLLWTHLIWFVFTFIYFFILLLVYPSENHDSKFYKFKIADQSNLKVKIIVLETENQKWTISMCELKILNIEK